MLNFFDFLPKVCELPFFIVKMLQYDSNIPSNIFYSAFIGETLKNTEVFELLEEIRDYAWNGEDRKYDAK